MPFIVKVHLTSSTDPLEVREVDIPDQFAEHKDGNTDELLDLVYYYGDNDIQRKRQYSVSMGDTIELNGKLFLVNRAGFKEISQQEYEEYLKVPRRDRTITSHFEY